jgi:hypothetical protein
MKFAHCLSSLALASILLASAPSVRAESAASWDGTWVGSEGRRLVWPISISVAEGKVVTYTLRGVAFPVRFSEVTPTKISFGDRDHYLITLRKTGDRTASGQARGRRGEGPVSINKE